MFLNRGGHPLPLPTVKIDTANDFSDGSSPQRDRAGVPRAVQGDKLTGSVKLGERTVEFVGVRPPKWPPRRPRLAQPGTEVELSTASRWMRGTCRTRKPSGWSIVDGAMTNTPHANNLIAKQKLQDYKIHAEYQLEKDSNSGIYIRGRYELQVLDDFGKEPFNRSHMSVYGWHAPAVNASKPVGEWQTMDATIVGNKVTVILNGQKVQDNSTLEAITGGALDANESEPGPVMIQGDHEKVTYRKVTVTPILDGRK